jgi:hypothetical protein
MNNKSNRQFRFISLFRIVLALSGGVAAMDLSVTPAKGTAALWISGFDWSYSAAFAQSPEGTGYGWYVYVGPGAYTWAFAYSDDGDGNEAYAFAEAADGQGGMGMVQEAGIADPWAGNAVNIPLIDPSNPANYPTNTPANQSDLFTAYTVSDKGIIFSGAAGSGEEMNGDDELQAFVYTGSTKQSDLLSEFGASTDGGTQSNGDVVSFSTLESDFGNNLIPLDAQLTIPAVSVI